MKRKVKFNEYYVIGLMLLLASVMLGSGCKAEPVKPEVILRGTTTKDAVITVKWPNTYVAFTGREIETVLRLVDGDLILRQHTRSKTSGLPVVDWYYRSDDSSIERHRLHLSADLKGSKMVVALHDSLTGMVLKKKVPATLEMAPAVNEVHTSLQLQKQALVLFSKGGVDLSQVLKGGEWKSTDVVFDGYEGALEWQCQRPDSSVKPRYASCYCNGSDDELDTPSCWEYRRTAYVAFRKSENNAVEFIVFEVNFDTSTKDMSPFLASTAFNWVTPPKTRTFSLVPIRR